LHVRCSAHARQMASELASTSCPVLAVALGRFFDKRKTGELLSRLSSDTTELKDVATISISMFLRAAIQVAPLPAA
jgi:hypothetical protein